MSDAGDSATGTLADGSGAASSTGTSVLHARSSASAAAIAGLIARTIAPGGGQVGAHRDPQCVGTILNAAGEVERFKMTDIDPELPPEAPLYRPRCAEKKATWVM